MKRKIEKNIGYELRDIAIIQAPISYVNSRSHASVETEIADRKHMLPVFVAPMATVVSTSNIDVFIKNGATPVIPRCAFNECEDSNDFWNKRMYYSIETFVSLSLSDAFELADKSSYAYFSALSELNRSKSYSHKLHICVDIAHGTLSNLFDVCKRLKTLFGDRIEIMTGNVANPEAYRLYCKNGIDWMRCSIGTGSRCTTSCHTAIHYPMATLLDDMASEKEKMRRRNKWRNIFRRLFFMKPLTLTKIIADGGINGFDDIQKCLVLGADAVMCGKLFNECEEAVYTPKYALNESEFMKGNVFDKQNAEGTLKKYRDYFGMSSDRAKPLISANASNSPEGISRPTEVKYTVAEFMKRLTDYLRSCMSYTNCKNIGDLYKNAHAIILGSGDVQYRKDESDAVVVYVLNSDSNAKIETSCKQAEL